MEVNKIIHVLFFNKCTVRIQQQMKDMLKSIAVLKKYDITLLH